MTDNPAKYSAVVTYLEVGSYEYVNISSYSIESNKAIFYMSDGIVVVVMLNDAVMGVQIKPVEGN